MSGDAAFHEGELALQELVGASRRLAEVGPRFIRDHMPQQHRDFFAQLPFLVAGAVDVHGQPWASLLCGAPGFARSPDERSLQIDARAATGDPLDGLLERQARVGLLGIEAHTRRRNRMNGRIVDEGAGDGLTVVVEQSFGNCPKYIQARQARFEPARLALGAVESLRGLDDAARRLVQAADTLFIATTHPQVAQGNGRTSGVDVSHRGGRPGFVAVEGDALWVPDYVGNSYFNTLGNLRLEPRCGLLFVDFERADALWVAARAEIVLEAPDDGRVPRPQRWVRLQVRQVRRRAQAFPLAWGPAALAPELAGA